MKKDYTHITVILDRSGSMEDIKDDTIGGFNSYLASQQAESGTATLTLVQFDTPDAYEVIHRFQPITKVPALSSTTYVPRGLTPLFDALGRGINDLAHFLANLPAQDQPAKVIMVVVTDGQENSSCEFDKPQVEKMIAEKTERDSWQFVFLSADLSAMHEAMHMGIRSDKALMFQKSRQGSKDAWDSLNTQTSKFRGQSGEVFAFDPDDRKHPQDPNKKKD